MATTSQRVLRAWIVDVLASAPDGAMPRRDVLDQIERAHAADWSPDDLRTRASRPFEATWRNNASYERADMVRAGLLAERADGVWALADPTPTMAAVSAHTAPGWDVEPGEYLDRASRATRYGGSIYGGIEPSRTTPNIFLYSDPSVGGQFGYNFDGWTKDQTVFLYTGEGPSGDQLLSHGNKSIEQHVDAGRAIRLFVADGHNFGTLTVRQMYVGEFMVDRDVPYIREDAAGSDGVMRSVIVFQLRPVGPVIRRTVDEARARRRGLTEGAHFESVTMAEAGATENVPTERVNSYDFQRVAAQATIAYRREADLTDRFGNMLRAIGHDIQRFRISPPGVLVDLYTDLVDHTENVLYEAKATATRDAVRMAIGQLLDYRRHVPRDPQLAVLLPSRPNADLLDLLGSLSIGVVYPGDGKSWLRIVNGSTGDFRRQ